MKQTTYISSIDFDYLRALVQQHSAVVLDGHKTYLAELYLQPIAEAAGFNSITELIAYLRHQPLSELHIQAIEAMVTNETSFFRDTYPFETLRQFVLPELIKKRRIERSLNIWCAACSHGQEPYSIAMLIREYYPILNNWSIQIIASDFSSKVLARAKKGHYNQLEIKRGLPKNFREKYFQQQESEWQIKNEIRQMVDFHQINLVHSWSSLPDLDIIFLRNVLIYFDIPTKKVLLKKAQQQLRPDGYLFLGSGETTLNLNQSFERVQFSKSICYRLQHRYNQNP
jgi:chemotaxis protein methyltransferase CheR